MLKNKILSQALMDVCVRNNINFCLLEPQICYNYGLFVCLENTIDKFLDFSKETEIFISIFVSVKILSKIQWLFLLTFPTTKSW